MNASSANGSRFRVEILAGGRAVRFVEFGGLTALAEAMACLDDMAEQADVQALSIARFDAGIWHNIAGTMRRDRLGTWRTIDG